MVNFDSYDLIAKSPVVYLVLNSPTVETMKLINQFFMLSPVICFVPQASRATLYSYTVSRGVKMHTKYTVGSFAESRHSTELPNMLKKKIDLNQRLVVISSDMFNHSLLVFCDV